MNRDRLTAALITLLISALIVVALCVITLGAAAVNPLVPENKDDDEILFTEVEIKQIPFKPVRAADNRPAASAAAEVSGTTDHDSG
ncbi:MAG: hypothetical protein K2G81_05390, partial [Muribaculaceae bacterium]|nr:hypothetical protein [Muribaculaceae bacterium]